jgi:hypothetical protein
VGIKKGDWSMEITEQLKILNQNLNALLLNQAILYCKLEEIQGKIRQKGGMEEKTGTYD